MRFDVPMLFVMAVFFNFLFGGITGVYVSDVPINVTVHGSYFVMAHFHYTIMGQLMFSVMAAIYYYTPLYFGIKLSEKLGKIHFWTMFIAFNSTFLPLFALGLLGMPRRVFEYAQRLQHLNQWVSVSAFILGLSLAFFAVTFVWQLAVSKPKSPPNPWESRGLEWQVGYPVPHGNFAKIPVILAGPYEYGDPNALPVAELSAVGAHGASVSGGDE